MGSPLQIETKDAMSPSTLGAALATCSEWRLLRSQFDSKARHELKCVRIRHVTTNKGMAILAIFAITACGIFRSSATGKKSDSYMCNHTL